MATDVPRLASKLQISRLLVVDVAACRLVPSKRLLNSYRPVASLLGRLPSVRRLSRRTLKTRDISAAQAASVFRAKEAAEVAACVDTACLAALAANVEPIVVLRPSADTLQVLPVSRLAWLAPCAVLVAALVAQTAAKGRLPDVPLGTA